MAFKIRVFIFALIVSSTLNAFQEKQSEKYQDSIRVEVTKLSDSLRAQKYYNASFHALQKLNDLKLARMYADSAMYYAKASNFKDSEAKSHFQFGLLERIDGNYEKALNHLETNIQYFKNDSTLMSYSLFQVGVIHKKLGDYDASLRTYLTILNIFETKKDSFAIASTLNSIGNIYGEMKLADEAITNFKSALKIFEAKESEREIGNAFENIGKMYFLKGDVISARRFLEKALLLARNLGEDYQIARSLRSLSTTYNNSNSKKGYDYLIEAKALFEHKNFDSELISVYREIGDYYKDNTNYLKAIDYYSKSLSLAENLKELPNIKEAYKGLFETYKGIGNSKKALDFQSKYIKIKDSLFNIENSKAVNLLQKQFETKKKDAEINEQNLRLKEQENLLQKKQIQTNYAIGLSGLFLILSIASWLVYKQRQKRKDQELLVVKNEAQIQALESLIEGEEKERFRIAKELHDGVNGDLSAIKHKLNTLLKLNNKTIEETVVMIDKSCEQVRAISHNLVPPALENFDLQTAASDYCTNMNSIHAPRITFNYIGDALILPKIVEVNIFRIIQELVTNSIKHAKGSEINVQLSCRANALQLAVDDDGVGFDLSKVKQNGVGLSNIKNRVSFLNGEIDFSSSTKGTSVNIFMDKKKFNND